MIVATLDRVVPDDIISVTLDSDFARIKMQHRETLRLDRHKFDRALASFDDGEPFNHAVAKMANEILIWSAC